MQICSYKDGSSLTSSPVSSPNISTILKIKVLSRSKETGLPASVRVRVCNKIFNLHKSPLCTKCGYFKEREDELEEEINIPTEFPGGAETFEKIMLFIYGCPTLVNAFDIAELRCAAEFLGMTQQGNNLCERFDLYLNQVVLQNWEDTLVVLKKCQDLLPWSQDLLIVSRCIESLAFMASMEILDPERGGGRENHHPVVMVNHKPWDFQTAKKIINQYSWIKDLTDLPFGFFRQVTESLRRQGMKERYVSPLIVFYAANNVCFASEAKTNTTDDDDDDDTLQRALDLLLAGDNANKFVPIGFYLSCLTHPLKQETLLKLQDQIVSLLHTLHPENFIYPKSENREVGFSKELLTMESLFSAYVVSSSSSSSEQPLHPAFSARCNKVGKLWDVYLSRLPYDQEMKTSRFIELIETIPMSFRETHDILYLSVNAFLKVHKSITQDELGSICGYLNCRKLSQETSLQLVQNDQMPLRLVVQALFVQQLNTHQAFKDSFRFKNSSDFFYGNVFSSSSRPLTSQQSSSCTDDEVGPRSRHLRFVMKRDATFDEYESTSFRINNLEEQIISLKKSIESHNSLKKPIEKRQEASKHRNSFGEIKKGCIGSVSFTSQRKYANRLLRVLRRVNLFGSRKTNRKDCESER